MYRLYQISRILMEESCGNSPEVVPFAVGFAVPYEARTRLVKVRTAVGTLEACSMPLQVGCYPQDVLVLYAPTAAYAQRGSPLAAHYKKGCD